MTTLATPSRVAVIQDRLARKANACIPCVKCNDPRGRKNRRGHVFRQGGLCLDCFLKSRRCIRCGTLGGEGSDDGIPRRKNGHCMDCHMDIEDQPRIPEFEARKAREARRKIESLDCVIKQLEKMGFYHASEVEYASEAEKREQEEAEKPFNTASMVKEYTKAMANIKFGWCSELGTGRLVTAKQLVREGKLTKDFGPVAEKEKAKDEQTKDE